jgi:ATP-binding cassette subfamily C protein CydD
VIESRAGSYVLLALAQGLLVVAQADLLSRVLAGSALFLPLVAVVAGRALLTAGQGTMFGRTAARRKRELRGRLLERGADVTLLGRGLDALDPYYAGYLPQRYAAAVVPVAVLARLVVADWPSALIIAVTLPLIPVFGAIVGLKTKQATERQWGLLHRLGGHFLDVVAGLSTLRAYGRDGVQTEVVRAMADGHRRATVRTLRIAFLSSFVLEIIGTLSVALVAVPAGLRLLDGSLDLRVALLVLLLAPEAYLPLRVLGTRFHAAAEGRTVLDQVEAALEAPEPYAGTTRAVPATARIEIDQVVVRYEDGRAPALDGLSLTVEPGEHVALAGPSGAGKSTLLQAVLGFVPLESGRILVDGTDLAELDLAAWRRRVAYVPQRPHLFAGSVAENIRLGRPDADDAAVRAAAEAAAAHEFIAALPDGYATELGERGFGLSTGQRQRIAIARAHLVDAPIVVMDEPTARLDLAAEAAVAEAAARLLEGRTALLVAHRPALLSIAHRVVHLAPREVLA